MREIPKKPENLNKPGAAGAGPCEHKSPGYWTGTRKKSGDSATEPPAGRNGRHFSCFRDCEIRLSSRPCLTTRPRRPSLLTVVSRNLRQVYFLSAKRVCYFTNNLRHCVLERPPISNPPSPAVNVPWTVVELRHLPRRQS